MNICTYFIYIHGKERRVERLLSKTQYSVYGVHSVIG